MSVNKSFTKEKVLVTGASGFLGSHIADALAEIGYEVIVFDLIESQFLQKSQKMVVGDILDYEALSENVKGCEYVYHFAGVADIDESGKNPEKTTLVNIIGTQNIIKACVKNQVKRMVFASTIYVYSDLGSFYRVSKQACEKLIEEYGREFGLKYTILRFGSLYGPRANRFNSITHMLKQAKENNKIIRRGDGEEIREYIHVKDAANLSVKILAHEYENEHLIITGKQSLKIKEFLNMIKEIFNNNIKIIYEPGEELHHYKITPFSYRPQVARRLTPEPFYDLGQGLMEVLQEIEKDMHKNDYQKRIGLRSRKKCNNK
jgi:UDP-glucose 4-epimerase